MQGGNISVSTPNSNSLVSDLERIIKIFKPERIAYLIITSISAVVLLVSAIFNLIAKGSDPAVLTLLFGSTGLMGFTSSRLLSMYNDALKILQSHHD